MIAPRLVVTVGLHGSASTSLFNIVRELMIAAVGEAQVLALYGEDVAALPAPLVSERRHVVLKSHSGSPGWEWLIHLTRAPVVLSVRDPRDAVLSLMERFGMQLEPSARVIMADCRRAERCAEAGHAAFRYEDRFFDDATVAGHLASKLGLDIADATCREIGARYCTEGVRSMAANLSDLPPSRVLKTDALHLDLVTQIHRTHLGDGLVGKWRDRLSPANGAALTQAFAPFLERFGYSAG